MSHEHELQSDDAFAERVAKPLRTELQADATFEARAMSAVRAAAREQRRLEATSTSWWLRRSRLRLTPLANVALAAGFGALMFLGGRMTSARRAVVPAVHDTVHVIRFVLVDSNARTVSLVGSFNGWQKATTPLRSNKTPGVWTVDLPLRVGRHEYAFIVTDANGEHWVADPYAVAKQDEFETQTSIISVGT